MMQGGFSNNIPGQQPMWPNSGAGNFPGGQPMVTNKHVMPGMPTHFHPVGHLPFPGYN